jgi:hypothetical protein
VELFRAVSNILPSTLTVNFVSLSSTAAASSADDSDGKIWICEWMRFDRPEGALVSKMLYAPILSSRPHSRGSGIGSLISGKGSLISKPKISSMNNNNHECGDLSREPMLSFSHYDSVSEDCCIQFQYGHPAAIPTTTWSDLCDPTGNLDPIRRIRPGIHVAPRRFYRATWRRIVFQLMMIDTGKHRQSRDRNISGRIQ